MQTAIEASKDRDKERRKQAFEYGIESFIRTYAPTDLRERTQFEAQLVSLIRQTIADAQEPLLDRFTKLAMSIPTPFVLLDK